MRDPYPRFFRFFVSGAYDRLFAGVAAYRGEECDYVHLAADNGKWWAVIKPSTNRAGVVYWSNFLASGAVVRSKFPWTYARRKHHEGTLDTMVNPKWLSAFRVGPTYVPLHSLRNACERRTHGLKHGDHNTRTGYPARVGFRPNPVVRDRDDSHSADIRRETRGVIPRLREAEARSGVAKARPIQEDTHVRHGEVSAAVCPRPSRTGQPARPQGSRDLVRLRA